MKTKITRTKYVSIVWITLIIGLFINGVFSTIGIMNGFEYYSAVYMGFGLMIVGFSLGLAWAHSWEIKN